MTIEQDFDSIDLMESNQPTLVRLIWENPMGETSKDALRLDLDHKLKLEFHGTKPKITGEDRFSAQLSSLFGVFMR